jgi:hypothetical protein
MAMKHPEAVESPQSNMGRKKARFEERPDRANMMQDCDACVKDRSGQPVTEARSDGRLSDEFRATLARGRSDKQSRQILYPMVEH